MSIITTEITNENHNEIYQRIKTKYKDFILSEALRFPNVRKFTMKIFNNENVGYKLDEFSLNKLEKMIIQIFEFNQKQVIYEFFEDRKKLDFFYYSNFHNYFKSDRLKKRKTFFMGHHNIADVTLKSRTENLKRKWEYILENKDKVNNEE